MSIADENWPYKDAAATAGGSPPDDAKTWTPEWVLCENGQCDFGIDVTTIVILQRCRTEDGNWLYMAVSTSTRESEGGVALAIEQKGVQP